MAGSKIICYFCRMKRCIPLVILILILFFLSLFVGAVHIPFSDVLAILAGNGSRQSWNSIVLESRLPQSVTAMLCGAGLSVSGLMLQTLFRNPLAGPDILGLNSGAGLGVAIVMFLVGGQVSAGSFSLGGNVAIVAGAFAGALLVMGIILLLSRVLRNNIMLLIAGILVSYLAQSAVTLVTFFATSEGVHSYAIWGMGNFGGVGVDKLPLLTTLTLVGLSLSVFLIKPLNALLLGDHYAENLGINIRRSRTVLLLSTGLLVATCTAFCGPISFIGLTVPHVARMICNNNNHRITIPFTVLCGIAIALFCTIISSLPTNHGIIPLNAITPFVGVPVILYVILHRRF